MATLGLVLFGLALAPRWLSRDSYVTADEDNWMRRAGGFAWGVANGRLGRTYQNGHPGVLTMELAILGQGPGGAERFADPVTGNPRVVSALPGFFEGLTEARRAFALSTAALVAALGLTAFRLFGPGPATFGAVLLLADPFLHCKTLREEPHDPLRDRLPRLVRDGEADLRAGGWISVAQARARGHCTARFARHRRQAPRPSARGPQRVHRGTTPGICLRPCPPLGLEFLEPMFYDRGGSPLQGSRYAARGRAGVKP